MKALTTATLAIMALAISTPTVGAQDEGEIDPREIVKQIQKDLDELVDSYAKLAGDESGAGEKVVENIDKLLEGLDANQKDVVKSIDELLKNMKQSQSSSGGGGGQSSSSKGKGKNGKPKARDRNKDPNEKPGQGKPKPKGKKPDGGKKPNGPEKSQDRPGQKKSGQRPPGSKKEKVPFIDDRVSWGKLPPETQQLLIENNFRDYFPDYDKAISDYLKSLNRRRKK